MLAGLDLLLLAASQGALNRCSLLLHRVQLPFQPVSREGHQQPGRDTALTEPCTAAAPWLCWECAPKAGEGVLKGWEPAACCTERCPLGKGTAARAAGWFEQLSSLKETSVSNSQQKLSKLEIYFIWLQCFAALQETSTSGCFCGCCIEMPHLTCEGGSCLMKLGLGSARAGTTKKYFWVRKESWNQKEGEQEGQGQFSSLLWTAPAKHCVLKPEIPSLPGCCSSVQRN